MFLRRTSRLCDPDVFPHVAVDTRRFAGPRVSAPAHSTRGERASTGVPHHPLPQKGMWNPGQGLICSQVTHSCREQSGRVPSLPCPARPCPARVWPCPARVLPESGPDGAHAGSCQRGSEMTLMVSSTVIVTNDVHPENVWFVCVCVCV